MSQPELKQVFYFDLMVFILVFLLTLVANFTARSIRFNITVSAAFLVKCLLGTKFRHHKSFTLFRLFFIQRLLVDVVLILPIVITFKLTSATYSYNYVIVVVVLTLAELAIFLRNITHLYKKTIVECIE